MGRPSLHNDFALNEEETTMTESLRDIAKMLDHSLLHPALTGGELAGGWMWRQCASSPTSCRWRARSCRGGAPWIPLSRESGA